MPDVSARHVIHIRWYARSISSIENQHQLICRPIRNSHSLICRVYRLLHCWFSVLTTRSQNQTHQVLKYYSVETTRKPLLTFNLDLLVERCWGSWTHGDLQVSRFTALLNPGEDTARKLGKVVHWNLLVEWLEQGVHEHLEHLEVCCIKLFFSLVETVSTWNFVSSATKFSGICGALMWALTSCS